MLNNGSNVSATIICEKGVGRPTQACLILKTLVSIVDESGKESLHSVHENSISD